VDSFDTDRLNVERDKGITRHGIPRAFVFGLSYPLVFWHSPSLSARLIWIGLIGFFILFTYSAPVIRIKSRPFLELVAVTVGCALLPYVAYHIIINQSLTWQTALTILFFSAGFPAIQLINEGADYAADKKAGITTTTVFLGEKNNLILVSALSLASTI